jgi:hypothetical protein
MASACLIGSSITLKNNQQCALADVESTQEHSFTSTPAGTHAILFRSLRQMEYFLLGVPLG